MLASAVMAAPLPSVQEGAAISSNDPTLWLCAERDCLAIKLALRLLPLKLPCRKAPYMNVVFVQARAIAVMGELDLELQFIICHGLLAHRAERANTRAAPGAVRPT